MAVTKSQALAADMSALRAFGAAMRSKSELIKSENDNANRAVDSTVDAWTGDGANAARGDFDRLYMQVQLIAEAHLDMASAAESAAGVIEGYQQTLRAAVSDAEGSRPPFRVDEDGSVMAPTVAEDRQGSLNEQAKVLAERIQKALDGINNEDIRAKTAIAAAAEEIPTVAAISAAAGSLKRTNELTAADAKADAEALADGHLTAEERRRLDAHLAAAGLDEATLPAAMNGTHPVPQSTLDYLQGLQKHLDRDGLINASRELTDNGSPSALHTKQMVANSILAVSNDKVVGVDRNGRLTGDTGGWDKLNPEIKEFVTTRASNPNYDTVHAPDANADNLPDDYQTILGDADYVKYHEDMSNFASLLGASNEGYEPGRNLAIQLDRQAAHLAYASDGSLGIGLDFLQLTHSEVDQTAQNLMRVGGRNEDATHAILTGAVENLDPGDVFVPIFTHAWDDNGEAAGSMFDWIGEQATDSTAAQRAGEAASGLAQMITETDSKSHGNIYDRMLNIDSDDRGSIGQVNPDLVQHLGSALTPYIPDLAGVSDEVTATSGFGEMTPDAAAALFAVIDSDPTAAADFNANAYQVIADFHARYADSVVDDPGMEHTKWGYLAGGLQQVVDRGLELETMDRGADAEAILEAKKAAFDKAGSIAGVATAVLPGGYGMAYDFFAGKYEDSFLSANAQPATANGDYAVEATSSAQLYSIVQALEASGNLEDSPLLDEFRGPDGRLRSLSDVLGNAENPLLGRATVNQNIGNYLEQQGFDTARYLGQIELGRKESFR